MIIVNLLKEMDPRGRSERFRQSFRNSLWSSADYLVLPLVWAVATPYFVHELGTEQYGIWMLVSAFLGLSGLMAFGLGDATIKLVSKFRALGDEAAIVRVVRSTLTMYCILAVIVPIASFFVSPYIAWYLIKVQPENVDQVIVALRIAGVGIGVKFIDSVFGSVLQGYERFDLAAKVAVPMNLIAMALSVLSVFLGWGLVGILWANVVVFVVSASAKASVARHILPQETSLAPIVHRAALGEIFEFGFYSWLQGFGGLLLAHADRLIIASMLGAASLAYYTICLQIAQQLHVLLAKAVAFLFPLISAASETKENPVIRRLYFSSLHIVTVCAVGLGLPLFIFAHDILRFWLGEEFASQATTVLQVLSFAFTLLATSIVPHYIMNGAGFVKLNTLLGTISGALVAASAFAMIPLLGLAGASWARVCNTPVSVVSRMVVHYKILHDRHWYLSALIFVLPLSIFSFAWLISQAFVHDAPSLLVLTVSVVVVGFIGATLTSILGTLSGVFDGKLSERKVPVEQT